MNADIARLLAPHIDAVQEAQAALDAANRAPNGLTVTYAAAGRLIRAYQAYTAALTHIIDMSGPVVAECGCETTLRTQGRLMALAEVQQKVHTH